MHDARPRGGSATRIARSPPLPSLSLSLFPSVGQDDDWNRRGPLSGDKGGVRRRRCPRGSRDAGDGSCLEGFAHWTIRKFSETTLSEAPSYTRTHAHTPHIHLFAVEGVKQTTCPGSSRCCESRQRPTYSSRSIQPPCLGCFHRPHRFVSPSRPSSPSWSLLRMLRVMLMQTDGPAITPRRSNRRDMLPTPVR